VHEHAKLVCAVSDSPFSFLHSPFSFLLSPHLGCFCIQKSYQYVISNYMQLITKLADGVYCRSSPPSSQNRCKAVIATAFADICGFRRLRLQLAGLVGWLACLLFFGAIT
jgi:hypothetical protein